MYILKVYTPKKNTEKNRSTFLLAITHAGNKVKGGDLPYFCTSTFMWYLLGKAGNGAQNKKNAKTSKYIYLSFKKHKWGKGGRKLFKKRFNSHKYKSNNGKGEKKSYVISMTSVFREAQVTKSRSSFAAQELLSLEVAHLRCICLLCSPVKHGDYVNV